MQELQYINLMGESVTFGASPPYILAHITGTENSDTSRKTLQGANQHGETTVSLLRQDRKIDTTVNLYTLGRYEMYRERAELCSVLSADKAFDDDTGARARIRYTNDFGTWWTWAMPEKYPQWAKRIKDIHPSLKISFDCDSPYWFSETENHGGFRVEEDAFRLPLRFPIRFASRARTATLINTGHAPATVRITIQGEGEKPALINERTGKSLRLTAPLPKGATLRINTDPDDLYVIMEQDGISINAYGLLDVSTPLSDFLLAPGENRIAYDSGGASAKTSIHMAWYDRLEGV